MLARGCRSFTLGRYSLLGFAPLAVARQLSTEAQAAPPPMDKFDYLVVGGGSGGVASARRAAMLGKRVALVERGPEWDGDGVRRGAGYGGTCVNVGCVPKKLMYTAASFLEAAAEGEGYGVEHASPPKLNWATLTQRRNAYVERLNTIYAKNLDNQKVERVIGVAKFVGPNEVEITSGEHKGRRLSAENVLIAVGGAPLMPAVPGAELAITSDSFFELPALPKRALIVGSGYIGVELAGILHAMGSHTSLLCRGDGVLRHGFDPMLTDVLNAELVRTGVDMLTNKPEVASLARSDAPTGEGEVGDGAELIDVTLADGEVLRGFDCVMFAVGRRPVTDTLGLETTGVTVEKSGKIRVDQYQWTGVDGLYCVGDSSTSGLELTPVAIAAGRRLADRLFSADPAMANVRLEYENVPTVVFSHPPIGTIGMSEPDARAAYGDGHVSCYVSRFRPMQYALCDDEQKKPMAMKLVCVGPDELVVGLHVIGFGADEMLQGFGVAVKMGATKKDFDHCVAIHPTASEEFVTMAPWGARPADSMPLGTFEAPPGSTIRPCPPPPPRPKYQPE